MKSARQTAGPHGSSTPTPQIQVRKPWFRRLARRVLLALAACVAVWFAPWVVSVTPLRHTVTQWIFADVQGTVSVRGVSLGWFSPIVAYDVTLHDSEGNLVLEVPQIQSELPLLQMAINPTELGLWRCQEPMLHVVFSEKLSNIEQVFAAYLQPSQDGASSFGMQLEVERGKMQIVDTTSDAKWTIDPLDVSLTLPKDNTASLYVNVHGKMPTQSASVGLQMILHGTQAPEPSQCNRVVVALQCQRFPLLLFEPLLRRFDPEVQLNGLLDANCHGVLSPADNENPGRFEGTLQIANLIAHGGILHGETIRLDKLVIKSRVDAREGVLQIEEADIRCDVGNASLSGNLAWNAGPAEILQQTDLQAKADIDLARLAALLPKTLRLRDDTQLSSGRITLSLANTVKGTDVHSSGILSATAIQGVVGGKTINWPEPVSLAFDVHRSPGNIPTIDSLYCRSDFLNVWVSGSSKQWSLEGDCNLSKLQEKLSQFADLGEFKLSGTGTLKATVQSDMDKQFAVDGSASIANFEVAGLGKTTLRELSINMQMKASGTLDNSNAIRLTTATLSTIAGNDELRAELLAPLVIGADQNSGALAASIRGSVESWQNRLQPWLSGLGSVHMEGQGTATAHLIMRGDEIHFANAKADLEHVRIQGLGLDASEPSIKLAGAGGINLSTGAMTLRDWTFVSSACSFRFSEVNVSTNAKGLPIATGKGVMSGDIARMRRWLVPSSTTKDSPIRGLLEGTFSMQSGDGGIAVSYALTGKQILFGPSTKPAWTEPIVRLAGRGTFDTASDTLRLDELNLESSLFQGNMRGELAKVTGKQHLTVQGELRHHRLQLEQLLQPYLGDDAQILGEQPVEFSLSGPIGTMSNLSVANQTAGQKAPPGFFGKLQGDLRWKLQSVHAHGVRSGPIAIHARLADGWLHVDPIKTTLNDGACDLSPVVRLDPEPMEAYLRPGKVLDHGRITPEMCQRALKYALPAMAEMTQGSGEISLDIQAAKLPIADPTKLDMAGTITLHSARIGASPLLRELAILLQRPGEAKLQQEAKVPFRVVNGRVYHEKMELVFPDLTIRTRGWVGFDGRLQLVAEMPVPPKWLGAGRINEALAKQSITLPIAGTLDRPAIDAVALRDASRQFLRGAAQELLRQELENRLKNLFDPSRK